MKSYILFSAFGDEIRHHLICQSKEDAETKLVEFASNHIIDRIGKCNFVNTLENNVPTVVVLGGSTGALSLNEQIQTILPKILEQDNPVISINPQLAIDVFEQS